MTTNDQSEAIGDMEMNIEHPITLIDADNPLGLIRRVVVIEGSPADDAVVEELEEKMRAMMNEVGFNLHLRFRDRIKNMGVKWYDV